MSHGGGGEPIPLKEAARLLRCTTDDVRKLIADGKLTAVPVHVARSTCSRSRRSPRLGTCHRDNGLISLCRQRAMSTLGRQPNCLAGASRASGSLPCRAGSRPSETRTGLLVQARPI